MQEENTVAESGTERCWILLGSYLGVLLDYLEPSGSMWLLSICPEEVLGPIGVRLDLAGVFCRLLVALGRSSL